MTTGLSVESRRAEKSKISANWIGRVRQCLAEDDQQQLLESALAAAGIAGGDLASRRNIEQRQLDMVVEHILPHVPDITLRMFACAELTDLGVMGYAAINSDTVGRAMNFMYRYHELTSDRFTDRLEVGKDYAVVTPIPIMRYMHDFKNIAEDSLAGNWRTLVLLLGPNVDFKQASVHFDFPSPGYVASYHEVFDCPVFFNADRNELRFPATWLSRPVESANQSMADVCKAMCERLLGAGESSRETSQVVRRLLLTRPGRRMYRLEETAAELSLSPTQLRKRLYKAGTSYKKLVLEIRMALAQHYLLDTELAVQEIAYLLDYSSPAPFSRAFKDYYGLPPDSYRAAQEVR
jgi:AraC-like DNA-binding protein